MGGQHTGVHMEQGGNTMAIGATGEVTVASGGKLAQQTAEADLNQTISDPPTQAEVQAITDKIDAFLAKIRLAGILAS